MNANCPICSELYTHSDDIYSAPCGHVFHHSCLLQWINRSKSCPQCRKATTKNTMFRIYFNFSNTQGIILDAATLQCKLDSVEFDLKKKDKEISKYIDEKNTFEELYKASESQLEKLNKKVQDKNVHIEALKKQIEYLKSDASLVNNLQKENKQLKLELENLTCLQAVLNGSTAEVETMIKDRPDPKTLSTYVVTLKKLITQLESKKKLLQENNKNLQNKCRNLESEKEELLSKLKLCESSSEYYEKKYKEIEKENLTLKSINFSTKENEKNTEKANLNIILKRNSDSICESTGISESNVDNINLPASSSPYLNLKQNNMINAKQNQLEKTKFYILNKKCIDTKFKTLNGRNFKCMKQKQQELETSFDGLGGHSKPDIFPNSLKRKQSFTNFQKPKRK